MLLPADFPRRTRRIFKRKDGRKERNETRCGGRMSDGKEERRGREDGGKNGPPGTRSWRFDSGSSSEGSVVVKMTLICAGSPPPPPPLCCCCCAGADAGIESMSIDMVVAVVVVVWVLYVCARARFFPSCPSSSQPQSLEAQKSHEFTTTRARLSVVRLDQMMFFCLSVVATKPLFFPGLLQ
jgi:hypothetical protein